VGFLWPFLSPSPTRGLASLPLTTIFFGTVMAILLAAQFIYAVRRQTPPAGRGRPSMPAVLALAVIFGVIFVHSAREEWLGNRFLLTLQDQVPAGVRGAQIIIPVEKVTIEVPPGRRPGLARALSNLARSYPPRGFDPDRAIEIRFTLGADHPYRLFLDRNMIKPPGSPDPETWYVALASGDRTTEVTYFAGDDVAAWVSAVIRDHTGASSASRSGPS
jgi:hypothetical protein